MIRLLMAEGQTSILKRLKSEVTCSLCLNIFAEPKRLPCDHVYCKSCLHGQLRSVDDTIGCSECHMSAPIPSNGVAGFPTPHQVNRLLEMYQDSIRSTEVKAQGFVTTCEIHTPQVLDFYCEACKKLVCSYCVITSCTKKSHKCEFLDDVIQSCLVNEPESLKKLHQDMSSVIDEILAIKDRLLESKGKNLKNIEEHFDALTNILKEEKDSLISKANKSFREQDDILTAKHDELFEAMSGLESLMGSNDPQISTIESKIKFVKAFKQYKQTNATCFPFEMLELEFSMCCIDELKKIMLGEKIAFINSDPVKCLTERCRRMQIYGKGPLNHLPCKGLEGVAALKFYEGKLYAVQKRVAVNVIDPVTLTIEKVIEVPGINEIAIDGSHIYATDIIEHRLMKLKLDGTIIASTGTQGDGPGQFDYPNGVRLSKDNEIYVCDSRNNRIQVFDENLNLHRILGKKGSDNGCFSSPDDLDFDEDGNIYVADDSNGRIQVLTPHGRHIRNIGRSSSNPREQLEQPISSAVHRGFVYVTDYSHACVFVFKVTGEFVKKLGENILPKADCLTVDDRDFIYVSFSKILFVKIPIA